MLPLAACASSSTLHHAGRAPNAFAAGAPRHAWFARVRRGTGVVALSSSQQDAGQRPVALPSGVLWMLDALSGGYYNVRGEEFVINRAEARHDDEPSFKRRFRRRNKGNAVARVPGSAPSGASMLQRAVWEQPAALMLVSDGALIDVPLDDDVTVELASLHVSGPGAAAPAPASATAAAAAAVAPSSATGIVHVPSSESTAEQVRGWPTHDWGLHRTRRPCPMCGAVGALPQQSGPMEGLHRAAISTNACRTLIPPPLRWTTVPVPWPPPPGRLHADEQHFSAPHQNGALYICMRYMYRSLAAFATELLVRRTCHEDSFIIEGVTRGGLHH